MIQVLVPLAVHAHSVDELLLADGGIRGPGPDGIRFGQIEQLAHIDMGRGYRNEGIRSDCGYRIVLQIQHLKVL